MLSGKVILSGSPGEGPDYISIIKDDSCLLILKRESHYAAPKTGGIFMTL